MPRMDGGVDTIPAGQTGGPMGLERRTWYTVGPQPLKE